MCRGGLPAAVPLDGRDRREFLVGYARALASRDARELGRVPASVDLLAVARAPDVMDRLLGLLETIDLHYRIPAWSRNLTTKTTRRPKVHITDSGLSAALLGVDAAGLSRPDAVLSGAMLETFVAGESARQLTWSEAEASLYHWRDRDGAEVDLVLERPNGDVVGIEVKAALDLDGRATHGLRTMRDRLGARFVAGVVLHCGDRVFRLDDRIVAVPVTALWAGA